MTSIFWGYVAQWTRPQFGNPEVVGLSPDGGKKLAAGPTFSGQSYKRFLVELGISDN